MTVMNIRAQTPRRSSPAPVLVSRHRQCVRDRQPVRGTSDQQQWRAQGRHVRSAAIPEPVQRQLVADLFNARK